MRQTLQSLFGLELSTAQKVIVASVVILILLALLGLFVRQIQGGRLRLRGQAGGRQRQPRLGVVDTYDLDRQRQLVLIRRDNIEHLVMIGGASDVVVETNILRSGGRAVTPSYAEAAAPDRPLPPFETLVPPAEQPARAGEEPRKVPAAEAPDVLPPLPTRSSHGEIAAAAAASAGVAAALGLAGTESQPEPAPAKPVAPPPSPFAPAPPLTTGPAPSFAREHAPPPAVSAGELDDMTRQLEEALKRPFSAVRPAHLPGGEIAQESAAPPVKSPVEAFKPVEKPAAEKPPVQAPQPIVEPAPPVVQPAPEPKIEAKPEPVPAAPQRQAVSVADVEAELAAALGLTPERTSPAAQAPKAPEAKPVEAKVPEPAKPEPAPAPEPAATTELDVDERGIDQEELEEAFAVVEASKPEPAPEEKPKADKPTEPESKEIDPFSVDAIEAEFARLLGRDPKPKA